MFGANPRFEETHTQACTEEIRAFLLKRSPYMYGVNLDFFEEKGKTRLWVRAR